MSSPHPPKKKKRDGKEKTKEEEEGKWSAYLALICYILVWTVEHNWCN